MKKINLIIIISSILLLGSCSKSENLSYLSGYWEILSVTKDSDKIKNYPFNGTIDYFTIDKKFTNGFRKKVKPKIDGNFEVNMHQIEFKIKKSKKHFNFLSFDVELSNSTELVYGNGENFIETIVEIDSMNLVIKNSEGYSYKYKRFFPKNYLDE